MTLDEIPSGSRVAVDANILIYHFTGVSEQCRSLLSRGVTEDVRLFIPAHICLEFLHRRMMLEAVQRGLVLTGNPARKLAQKPEAVGMLRQSRLDFERLPLLGLEILPLATASLDRVPRLSAQHGLLTNDAALLATMEECGIRSLATADGALQQIEGVHTYCPSDL